MKEAAIMLGGLPGSVATLEKNYPDLNWVLPIVFSSCGQRKSPLPHRRLGSRHQGIHRIRML